MPGFVGRMPLIGFNLTLAPLRKASDVMYLVGIDQKKKKKKKKKQESVCKEERNVVT